MSGPPPAALAGVAVELARAQLAAGGVLRTTAVGHSMWPTIRDGDPVVIEPFGGGGPAVGDVALVAVAGRLVLHRVIALRGAHALTKGDAITHPDGEVPTSALLGRVRPRPWDPWLAHLSRVGGAPLARALNAVRVRVHTPPSRR